jgi:3-oxoacyl-[acyl-carrier-protein] synthase-1
MPTPAIAIRNVGLVTSVGQTAAQTCAALRAATTNPTPTRFIGRDGEWIMAHQVSLDSEWRGRVKLCKMAALAAMECLEPLRDAERRHLPLLLCVAERTRPGRLEGLDDELYAELEAELGLAFHREHSAVVPMGRPSVLLALAQARRLIHETGVVHVLIVAADSLLEWTTLMRLGDHDRLLAERNSNGFLPGEAAGAVLVSRPGEPDGELLCTGVGAAIEPAPLMSGEPLRAEGLSAAIIGALEDAGCEMHDLDFRISDIAGEQYFFKEAALALSRLLRRRKEEFDLWHPAEGIGETGAAAGVAMIANALFACRKGYAKGPRILLHSADDGERRVAAILNWTKAAP